MGRDCRFGLLSHMTVGIFARICVIAAFTGFFLVSCAYEPTSEVWFVDEAAERGVTFRLISGYRDRPYLPEIMGGGVALVDIENDGDLDIYFVQGGWHLGDAPDPTALPPNEIYINDGTGRFSRQPHIVATDQAVYGMGVTAGDYDNDGDTDLYVTNLGENVLLQNDGQGNFTNVTEVAGVSDPAWSTAAAFADFDGDADLDLFVVNNLKWSVEREIDCYARGVPTYCLPTNYQAPAPDSMFRNNGDGTFTNVSAAAGFLQAYGNGLGTVPADFDGNGQLDLFVANDTMVNQLWLNQGDWKFVNHAVQWACAVDNHGFAKAGMGVDAVDLDDDADKDVIVVNLEGQSDSVYVNQGTYFRDQTSRIGLGAGSRRFTRFGVALADFNNDTVFDLYEANGKVDGDPKSEMDVFAEPNMLFEGKPVENLISFEPLTLIDGTGSPKTHTSRGLAVGDLDLDGDLDVVIVNRDATPYVLINQIGQDRNWIRFRVLNRFGSDALGATVSLGVAAKRQYRDVKVAGSYLTSHEPHVHFGLGDAETVQAVKVTWATGETHEFGDYDANQVVVLTPPST